MSGADKGTVENSDTVMHFVLLTDAAKDGDSLGDGRFVDDNLRETALKSS